MLGPSQHFDGELGALAPLVGPVAVIEAERRLPVGPVAFAHAKIVRVTSGRVRVRTETGDMLLSAGDALVLGSGRWAQATPMSAVRTWTICIDEAFLRHHLSWALPKASSLKQGLHPDSWDGQALHLNEDPAVQAKVEPLLRRMSTVAGSEHPTIAASLMALFAQVVEISLPTFVAGIGNPTRRGGGTARLVQYINPHIKRATETMRAELGHPWTVEELAQRTMMSRSQINRIFQRHVGIAPMRFLNEVRLTAFTRIMEETSLTVEAAAREVGWDRRTASRHFVRRHRISPTEFRAQPEAALAGESPCLLCPERICVRSTHPQLGTL